MSRKKHAMGGYAVLLQEAKDRLERARKRLAAFPYDEYAQKEIRLVNADLDRLKLRNVSAALDREVQQIPLITEGA